MRPEYENIVESPARSFTAKVVHRRSRPRLSQAWHFHPEIEICYTRKSQGRRFVGNQIAAYEEKDLVMFGSNLPHGFTTDVECNQVVIQMLPDFLGQAFIDKPELHAVKSLFGYARRGLEFRRDTKRRARILIRRLLRVEGMPQLLCLLELLHVLAQSDEVVELCSEEYALEFDEASFGRIKIVYEHVMENYRGEVRIQEIADKLNISDAAFYKFIKKQTKKTYTQIVNEFRVHHASKLLMTTDKTISQICFESGYNNLSYFNRKFKQVMHRTPSDFRSRYLVRTS